MPKNPANQRDFASVNDNLMCSTKQKPIRRCPLMRLPGYGGTSAKAQSRLKRDEHLF